MAILLAEGLDESVCQSLAYVSIVGRLNTATRSFRSSHDSQGHKLERREEVEEIVDEV